jgi:iron(III) transport system ATP-binding protein
MPDIVLENVDKSYDGRVKAVANLNLEIGDGDFMCLLGPSGCGKTTTLRMIAGLENLSAGEISVGDRIMDSRSAGLFVPPEQRGMGLVFQSYALWPHLTVERNTDFGLRLRRVPKAEREARVDHVMKTLGIDEYRDRYPSQLSGGQQQRVALARMLAINPDVLLLDEPLSNLDARLRLEMRAELKRIHSEFGTTIVFVTHDQWEAMTLATRIAVMHEGSLQQIGSPDDIYDRPANRFVAEFVGNPPINIIEIGAEQSGRLSTIARDYLAEAFPQQSSAGSIGLRPDNIQLTRDRAADGPARFIGGATIAAILPTGGSWITELEVAGAPLFMASNRPPRHGVGEDLYFQIERSAMHVFDPEGRRMQCDIEETQQAAS